jgi:chaperonin GroEL
MEISKNLIEPDESCLNSGEREGWKIFMESLQAPFFQMANNAGKNAEILFEKVKHDVSLGIDFSTEDSDVVELYENGIIDPFKVTKNALINAASAASTLMTTVSAIVEVDA